MAAITQLSKWGNSLGLRLPESVAREVRRVTPTNRHDERDWGGRLGDEVW